jgi:hypothetical protein
MGGRRSLGSKFIFNYQRTKVGLEMGPAFFVCTFQIIIVNVKILWFKKVRDEDLEYYRPEVRCKK